MEADVAIEATGAVMVRIVPRTEGQQRRPLLVPYRPSVPEKSRLCIMSDLARVRLDVLTANFRCTGAESKWDSLPGGTGARHIQAGEGSQEPILFAVTMVHKGRSTHGQDGHRHVRTPRKLCAPLLLQFGVEVTRSLCPALATPQDGLPECV